MSPLSWLGRFKPCQLSDEQIERVSGLPACHPLDDTALDAARLVVMDLETTGLNVQRDNILSIGAVVIDNGAIDMGGQFERTLYRADNRMNEAVLIHGIAPSEVRSGMDAADALLDFLEYAGSCVFLAFHAPFDQRMLARGLKQDLGQKLRHKFIDVAEMAPMLCPEADVGRGGLDEWASYFGLNNSLRHNAAADALATAEIALILLSKARMQGVKSLADLHTRLSHWRRLRSARTGGM